MSEESPPIQKKVDESWKEQVLKEKASAPVKGPRPGLRQESQPEPRQEARPAHAEAGQTEFSLFLSSLSMQALVALGEMPHPATQERQEDLEQGRYLIDLLGLLKEKTKGNLIPEEQELLEGLLYELRMKFVAKAKQP